MTKIIIIMPVEDYEATEKYYRKMFNFSQQKQLFFLPVGSPEVALKLMIIDEESKLYFPPKKRFPIFGLRLEKNFLSYCRKIYENGALIETAFSHPGGHYACVSDPAGNQFQIECEGFEEDDPTISSSTLAFLSNR